MGALFWITSIGASTTATLLTLVLGLRGRRIDNHPLCRRCGFDLFGLTLQDRRCSECGAKLQGSSAVRWGRRRKLRWIVVLAAAVLVLQISFFGIAVYVTARHIDPNGRKPTWWLIRETNVKSTRSAALAELTKRLKAGTLTSQQADALFNRALRIQGDTSVPWDKSWEQFLDESLMLGKLPDAQWVKYVRQSMKFKLDVRPVVASNMPLPMQLSWTTTGRGHVPGLFPMDGAILAAGRVLRFRLEDGPTLDNTMPLFATGLTSSEPSNEAETVKVTLTASTNERSWTAAHGRHLTPVKFELDGKYRISTSDHQTIGWQTDRNLEPAQRDCIQIRPVHSVEPMTSLDGQVLAITVNRPPVGMASDVTIGEYGTIGYLVAPAGRTTSVLVRLPPLPRRGSSLHVELVPDERLAIQCVYVMSEIWGKPIEMDVPVKLYSR